MRITSEVRFAITPEWVLLADVSDGAKVLYGLLARVGDDGGEGYVTKATLAERMHRTPRMIVNYFRELQRIGAIDVLPRWGPDGGQRANAFCLRVKPVSGGGEMDDTGGGEIRFTQNESQKERKKTLAPPGARATNNGVTERTMLKNAIVVACGYDPAHLTASGWGRIEKAAKELAQLDPVPDAEDLANLAAVLAGRYGRQAVTPQGITNNFADWTAGKLR